MKAEDIRTKTGDELKSLLLDLKKEQFNLRFQLSQGQLAGTARIRAVRRDIARVNTFLNQQKAGVPAAPKKAKAEKPKAEKAGKAEKAEKAKPAAKTKKSTGKKKSAA